MLVLTPFGTAKSRSEAFEILEMNGAVASDENFKPVKIDLEVWEQTGDGKMRFVRNKTVNEVQEELNSILRKYYSDIYEQLENGVSIAFDASRRWNNEPFPRHHWIACYVVRGCEGYWLHIDTIDNDGKRELIFLAKTLSSNISEMYRLAAVCAEVLQA